MRTASRWVRAFAARIQHEAMGTWQVECVVVEVDEGRRWVWNALRPRWSHGDMGFRDRADQRRRADPAVGADGSRPVGADRSRSPHMPEKEARIVAGRLAEWQKNMQVNLEWIRSQVES